MIIKETEKNKIETEGIYSQNKKALNLYWL